MVTKSLIKRIHLYHHPPHPYHHHDNHDLRQMYLYGGRVSDQENTALFLPLENSRRLST